METTELPAAERSEVPYGAAERLAPVLARLLATSKVAEGVTVESRGCDILSICGLPTAYLGKLPRRKLLVLQAWGP